MIDGTLDAHCWRCFSQNFSQISKSNFFRAKKMALDAFFFLLTAGDALTLPLTMKLFKKSAQFIGSSISNLYLQL